MIKPSQQLRIVMREPHKGEIPVRLLANNRLMISCGRRVLGKITTNWYKYKKGNYFKNYELGYKCTLVFT